MRERLGGLFCVLVLIGLACAATAVTVRAAASPAALYAYADGTAEPGPANDFCQALLTSEATSTGCGLAAALETAADGGTVYLGTPASAGSYVGNWTVTKSVTIEPASAGTGATLSGNSGNAEGCATDSCAGPVLDLPPRESGQLTLRLSGVTIERAANSGANGGGISNQGNVVVISDATFTGDKAESGGAIDSSGAASVTVTNSSFTNNTANDNGGAIDSMAGSVSLSVANSTFAGNATLGAGGAIWTAASGEAAITRSTFTGNSASFGGGAIGSSPASGSLAVNITDSTFDANAGGHHGGAVSNGTSTLTSDSALTISDSTFTGNSISGDGGAIDNGDDSNGTLTIDGSTFSGNSATADGGAIDSGDNESSGGLAELTVERGTTFAGNSAQDGGAIDSHDFAFVGTGGASVSGATFVNNFASHDGGAIDNADNGADATPLAVTRSTFSANSATLDGGALDNGDNFGAAAAAVTGSTFAGDSAALGGEIANPLTPTSPPNQVQLAADVIAGSCVPGDGLAGGAGFDVTSDASCLSAPTDVFDPGLSAELGPLAYNGGPTRTIALEPGNPAIGIVPPGSCPASDVRGVPLAGGAHCDAGAVETPTPLAIAVPSATITYGQPAPLTPGYAGFVLAQTPSSLGAEAGCHTDRPVNGAGTYAVVCTGAKNATTDSAGAPDTDYVFSYPATTLVVDKADQSIAFGLPPANPAVGEAFGLQSATATSGLPVLFSVDPSTANACSIGADGVTVSFLHAGSCVIDASQPGNANYNPAPQAQQRITIAAHVQTIAFSSTPPARLTVGDSYTPRATGGGSGNPVVFSIGPTARGVCSLDEDGRTVTLDRAGICVINANQAGTGDYAAAATQQQRIKVRPGTQAIWTDFQTGTIRVENTDGAVATLFGGEANPTGVAIDPAAGAIYWSDAGTGQIRVGHLDGHGAPRTLFAGESAPTGVAVDPVHHVIFWTDYDTNWNVNQPGSVRMGRLAPSGWSAIGRASTLFSGQHQPLGVTVDPQRDAIYWSDGSGQIQVGFLDRARAAASGSSLRLFAGQSKPSGLALNPANRTLFWSNNGNGTIMKGKINAGGNQAQGRAVAAFQGEDSDPFGIAIDPLQHRLYWTDYNHKRSNRNPGTIRAGSLTAPARNATTVFSRESGPAFLALLHSPVPLTRPALSRSSAPNPLLTCSRGTWAPDLPSAFFYQAPQTFTYVWTLNGAQLPHADSPTYAPRQGGSYTCTVIATNSAGSGAQTSKPAGVSPENDLTRRRSPDAARSLRRRLAGGPSNPPAVVFAREDDGR